MQTKNNDWQRKKKLYLDAYSWRDACWVASYPVAVDLYFGVPSSLAAEVDFAEEVVAAAVLVVVVVLVAVVGWAGPAAVAVEDLGEVVAAAAVVGDLVGH